jgi:hypothetical protein
MTANLLAKESRLNVSRLLRLEGLAVFIASILLFAQFNGTWWVYLLFFLAPDLSMLGYLTNVRTGAFTYNFVHNYAVPIASIFAGYFLKSDVLLFAGIILLGHIGADRLLGFGLKYPTAFKDTHLQRV